MRGSAGNGRQSIALNDPLRGPRVEILAIAESSFREIDCRRA
jgi:hypothetical protein